MEKSHREISLNRSIESFSNMDNILNILKPGPEILENYLYDFDKIVRVARLTNYELGIIDMHIYTDTLKLESLTMSDLFMYFQDGCISSRLRPMQYWKYLFESM
jgi:hypothetical protein